MDLTSTFIASILFCFFASNYFSKYKLKENIVNNHLVLSVITSSISEVLILYGLISNEIVFLIIGIVFFSLILLFQIYVSIITIKYLDKNKGDKNTFECVAIGINNILSVIGAVLIVVKYLIELIFKGILYNE